MAERKFVRTPKRIKQRAAGNEKTNRFIIKTKNSIPFKTRDDLIIKGHYLRLPLIEKLLFTDVYSIKKYHYY